MSDSPALQRYVELKQEIAALEAQLDELKEEVFKAVDSEGGKIATDSYSLTSQKRPKYKFSDDFMKKDKELKELRKKEIEEGTAQIESHSEFVTIKFKKA